MSERNLKRLLLCLAGALAVFLVCLIPVFFAEDAPSWAIWGTCVGGLGVLSFWSAIVVGSLLARRSSKRPAASPLPAGSRPRVRPANISQRRGQAAAVRNPQPLQEVARDADSVESDAALFLLAEPEPDLEAEPFRALGTRVASTGLPQEDLGPDDQAAAALLMAMAGESSVIPLASESNRSNDDWLRRVKGTNCKGRLCWICGRQHGPEVVHNSSVPLNRVQITVDVAERLGWLDGADYGGAGAPPG